MPNLNSVTLMGNMTRDPEIRYTPKGTAVGDIGLAVNRRVKINEEWQDETTFIDVTLWAKDAEFAEKYLTKGSPIFIQGRLQIDQWEDKQSGQKRSKLKVVAESIQGLQKPSGDARGGQQSPAPAGGRTQAHSSNQGSDYHDDGEDSIPFAPVRNLTHY